jgi:hypothetical protein
MRYGGHQHFGEVSSSYHVSSQTLKQQRKAGRSTRKSKGIPREDFKPFEWERLGKAFDWLLEKILYE